MTCSFCGTEIDSSAARLACSACGLSGGGCRRIRCPECGFEHPEEPGFVSALRGWWRRRRNSTACEDQLPDDAPRPLSRLRPGARALVVDLDRSDVVRARKLVSLGVAPGVSVEMERQRPLVVFNVGRTQLAFDAALAAAVLVRPEL
jgi:Fe2+ transport system protein FeoA